MTDGSKARAGIKQIADALGISIGTVDRALHARNGVSPKTRERVLKTARELNYSPNVAARNLKLNRQLRIGVFLPEQIASFFDPLRAGIRAASQENTGATVDVAFHNFARLGEGDVESMERHHWKQYDGIILAPGNPERLSALCMAAEEARKPVVFVATDAIRTYRLSSVAVEAAISGGIAAEILGQILPTKNIVVVITGDLRIQDHAEKLRGFAAGLATLAPHLTLLPAIESHESPDDAHRSALQILRSNPHLGGIYITTANSMPVIRALEESGRLGKVRVIATDLFPELAYRIESGQVFASLHQRPSTQGRMAFEILSRYLISGVQPRRVVRLAPHLILRSNLALFLDGPGAEEQEPQFAIAERY
jgi:LacI family transcriptional regulator